jgi:pimeloyl-ACP methyl ester carboxylesterase
MQMLRSVALLLLCAQSMAIKAQIPRDPAAQDQPRMNDTAPGGTAELKIPISSTRVNALMYGAQGAGAHPTVVLLHGFPGNERNLDMLKPFDGRAITRSILTIVDRGVAEVASHLAEQEKM